MKNYILKAKKSLIDCRKYKKGERKKIIMNYWEFKIKWKKNSVSHAEKLFNMFK
jgi:hypothetical protein